MVIKKFHLPPDQHLVLHLNLEWTDSLMLCKNLSSPQQSQLLLLICLRYMDKTWTKTMSWNLALEIQPYPQLFSPTCNVSRIYTYKYRAFPFSPRMHKHILYTYTQINTHINICTSNANLKGMEMSHESWFWDAFHCPTEERNSKQSRENKLLLRTAEALRFC